MIGKNRRLIISYLLIFAILLTSCTSLGKGNLENKDSSIGANNPLGEDIGNKDKEPVVENVSSAAKGYKFRIRDVNPSVKPYEVNADLSNIENLDQFGGFSKEQIRLLSENKFVVNPTEQEQLLRIY